MSSIKKVNERQWLIAAAALFALVAAAAVVALLVVDAVAGVHTCCIPCYVRGRSV